MNWPAPNKQALFFVIAISILAYAACGGDEDKARPSGTSYPAGTLVSQAVSTPPADNVTIDRLWADVPGITISTVVPAPDEKMDIWHWKRDRTAPVLQVDDKWLNDQENGRQTDAGTGAYSTNIQHLTTSRGDTVSAPMYWIPGREDYHWILQSEIDEGLAKRIVDMDGSGNLIDEDNKVLDKSLFGRNSTKCIPSLMEVKPATGSRGDVSVMHSWSNSTWTLKIKRLRDTGNDDDVQFTQTGTPYWFSIAVMNAAAIAHAIPGGESGDAYPMILGGFGARIALDSGNRLD